MVYALFLWIKPPFLSRKISTPVILKLRYVEQFSFSVRVRDNENIVVSILSERLSLPFRVDQSFQDQKDSQIFCRDFE